MTMPRLLAGPPASQSSARRNPHTGSRVNTGTRSSAGSARNHPAVPAYGLPAVIAANAITSMSNKKTTIFSGHAKCIAALIALFLAPVTAKAQQLYYPWFGAVTTQTSGTIATGGTFQTALASNVNRKGCLLSNTSAHTMYVFLGALASATEGKSVTVAAGGTFSCNYGPIIVTDNVNITTSTSTDTFVILSMQ